MKKKAFPNTYVIIAALILLSAIATWIVPGGRYATSGQGIPQFEKVESAPQTWQVFSALYDGFVKQAGIIVFILIVGGAFWILNSTGAVDYGIRKFIKAVGKKDKFVLAAIAVLFSLGGAVFGMSEETIPFVGIVVPLAISMGYDAIVGLLVVYVASNIGFSAAFLNPFTVGIAQEMSDLPLFSGMEYRIICWALLTTLLVLFTLSYASRIKKTTSPLPSSSPASASPANIPSSPDTTSSLPPSSPDAASPANILSSPDTTSCLPSSSPDAATGRKRWILVTLLATVVMLIAGVVCWKWYMAEISALFLAMGIISGIIGGYSANKIAEEFIAGAKDILSAALVVGLASGIVIILQNGQIMDTILHSLESSLGESSPTASLSAMYGLQSLINLVIPSATAKAAITMPIMAPFSDIIGLSRQATVLAFQFGDGFTNMITPTSGVLIAALAMAKVPYTRWARWFFKYVLILLALGFLLLLPTVLLTLPGF